MRLLTTLCAGLLTLTGALAADSVPYLSCDFEDGIPTGFMVYDNDAQPLHFLMKQLGFEQGDSWRVFTNRLSGNHYIGSPSMHSNSGANPTPANDWLISTPVLLRGDNPVLSWRASSINNQYDDLSSYRIYVSATAVTPDDDWGEPLVTADAPLDEWETFEIGLDEFEGQRVRIAFVNVSCDCEVLGLDDIVVSGGQGPAEVQLRPGRYALGGGTARLGALITASSTQPITSASVVFEVDGKSYTASNSDLNLSRGESVELWSDYELNQPYGTTIDYRVTATVNGLDYDPVDEQTTMLAFLPRRRVLLEETTGMWCGWCPLGILAIDSLIHTYGTDLIPIAVHVIASQDALAMDGYADFLKLPGAAPIGVFDRTETCSSPMVLIRDRGRDTYVVGRGGFGTVAASHINILPMAAIELDSRVSGRKIEVDVTARMAVDVASRDIRVALVLTEDNVWQNGYYQTNYLSSFDRGGTGDYATLPQHIESGMTFGHVARMVADNRYEGIPGSLPGDMKADQPYTFSYTFNLSSKVNVANANVVGLLVDAVTGEVLNANACHAGSSTTAVEAVASDGEMPEIRVSSGSVTVSSGGAQPVEVALYDLTGRVVRSAVVSADVTLTAPAGFYLLRVGSYTVKVSL